MTADTATTAPVLAANLRDMTQGRFIGLITRLKGKEKGRGDAKMLYGDAVMHYVLYFGYSYQSLVARSLSMLDDFDPEQVLADCKAAGLTGKSGAELTLDDAMKAVADLRDSFQRSYDGNNTATTEAVFEPLVVDGQRVPNARVYVGDKAEERGTIYLQALVIGRKCLEPAPNGPIPAANSRGDVVIKNWVRGQIPVGRLRQYILKRDGEFLLRAEGCSNTWVGQEALDSAQDSGVPVDMSQVA